MGKVIDRLKSEIHKNTTDAIAMVTTYTPPTAAIETFIGGISDEVSLKTRVAMGGLCFLGMASIKRAIDYSKSRLGINEKSGLMLNYLHDGFWGLGIVLGIRSGVYIAYGETDWKKLGISIGASALLNGLLVSGPAIHLCDIYEDFTGWKKSERVPELLRNRSRSTRAGVMTGLAAASIGLTGLVYQLTPEGWNGVNGFFNSSRISYETSRFEGGLEQVTFEKPNYEGVRFEVD